MPQRWGRVLVSSTHRISRPYGLTSETCWASPNSDTRHQGTGGRRHNPILTIQHYLRGSIRRRPTVRTSAKLPSWLLEVGCLSPYETLLEYSTMMLLQPPPYRITRFMFVDWLPWSRTERNPLCGSSGLAYHPSNQLHPPSLHPLPMSPHG